MHAEDFYRLIESFMDLNDSGRTADSNPEYFRAGFQLLCDSSPYGEGDDARMIVASLLYAHDDWFDPSRRPFDFI